MNGDERRQEPHVSDTTAQFKTQLPRNLSLQILSFVVQIGIGIWLVPYLVGHLGRAAYGLIPIAGIMTEYVSLISYNISSSVNRFLTIALQQKKVNDANRVFNTAFFSYLAIVILQIPAFGLVIYYANAIFTIPEELYRDVIILLICSATSFLINLVVSVFGVPLYANNRLDISRSIDIARQVLRVTGIVVLFLTLGPTLRYVGYVDLAISVASCLTTMAIGKRLAPELRLNFHFYDWRKVRELTAMGWWLFVNQIGFLLFLRMDIWVCNRFIGAEQAGDYAAILQWSNLIRSAGGLMAGIVAPMMMIYYARSEIERLTRTSMLSVRLFSSALAIPIGLMCVFSPSLLRLWLGESFVRLSPLMILMLVHLVVNVGVYPLFGIQMAVGRVKWPGLAAVFMGLVNLVLSILLAKQFGWGIYGVAIAGAITITLRDGLFTAIYGAHILKQPWHTFLKCYLPGLTLLGVVLLLGFGVGHCINPTSWWYLVLLCLAIGLIGLVVIGVILPKQDRRLIIELLPVRIRRLGRVLTSN